MCAKLGSGNFLGPLEFFNFINSEAVAYSKRVLSCYRLV